MSHWVSQNLSHGIHVYSGGEGSTVVLIPGWPETAEAYCELFPLLSQDHNILCVDPPGLGDSAPSEIGYDTEFSKEKLPMPVLALGGSGGMGEHLQSLIEPLAEGVDGGAVEDCEHYVMEEQPDLLARRLLDFFVSVEGSAR
jgi:pimeloyl-ACP methyl ester carboxylesterase